MDCCPECKVGKVSLVSRPTREKVGNYVSQGKADWWVCSSCGESFLDLKEKHRLELRAALFILLRKTVTGACAHDLRHIVGYTRGDLSKTVGISEEELEVYETSEEAVPGEIVATLFALVLCVRAGMQIDPGVEV